MLVTHTQSAIEVTTLLLFHMAMLVGSLNERDFERVVVT